MMSNKSGGDADDAQFLRDLEEAKRLSLASYSHEAHKRSSNGVPFAGHTAPFSGQRYSLPQPPPMGFVIPQTSQSSYQDSSQTPTRKPFQPPYSNHIPSTSQPKPIWPQSVSRSQSFPCGNSMGLPLEKNTNHIPFNPPQLQQSFTPNFQSAFPDTPKKSDSEKPSNISEVTNETNPYKTLYSEACRVALDTDLIDLGRPDDGRNVLEAFDPLFDKPASFSEQPKISTPNNVNVDGRVIASSSAAIQKEPKSASPPAYGWSSDVSLYPSISQSTYDSASSKSDYQDQSILYDAYSQFEYLYAVSISSETSSFYWNPGEGYDVPSSPPPTEAKPASDYASSESVRQVKAAEKRRHKGSTKKSLRLYEDITVLKQQAQIDGELLAFVEMLQRIRSSTKNHQPFSSLVYCPTAKVECWMPDLSLKLIVWNETFTADAVTFTCEVSTKAALVIEKALSKMGLNDSSDNYIMRIKGQEKYLDSSVPLIEFKYVQDCIKFDEDIKLVLIRKSTVSQLPWVRNVDDKEVQQSIEPEDITPMCHSKVITFTDISKFLEVIERESDKLRDKLTDAQSVSINPTPLIQTVKGICVHLGDIQTVEIQKAVMAFIRECDNWNRYLQDTEATPKASKRTVIKEDVSSRHSQVEIIRDPSAVTLKEAVKKTKDAVIESVRNLVEMYSRSFPVSFQMRSPLEQSSPEVDKGPLEMSKMLEAFIIRISALHRIKPEWSSTFADYFVGIEAFYGTRPLANKMSPRAVPAKVDDTSFFNSVIFDAYIEFEHLPLCILPKECRLVFTIYGRKITEAGDSHETVELGWAAIQCFDFQGFLARGYQLLPLWAVGMPQKRLGPAPNSAFSYDLNVPLITVEFPDHGRSLRFPKIPTGNHVARDFDSLDDNTKVQLRDIIENVTFTKFPAHDREVLWEKRHYLHKFPQALPKVLLAAQFWDYASLADFHAMVDNWAPLAPLNALQLLLPCFPDGKVRQTALKWITKMPCDEFVAIIPQFVEALSYETFDVSPLSEFILKKALSNYEITHALFWNLVSEVGIGRWDSESTDLNFMRSITKDQSDPRKRRLELMRNSLIVVMPGSWREALLLEWKLMQGLSEVTSQVKSVPVSQRQGTLLQELKRMGIQLFGENKIFTLPFSLAYKVSSIDIDSSVCFNSASVPLKVNFRSALGENGLVPMLYKQGDDIRQDMLTIQVIRMIESWWLKEGLDLRVVTFSCVAVGFKKGVVEIVPNAETLCKIQADYGVTGAFRNRPISEWLAKMNPSTLDYRMAVENFTRSCAAYCVLTYILGICDRHNDNIMLTNKGHLFHIDFGKFLGDAQMFGSFKRDRSPFVLTSDMLYVINEGEKVSERFHQFVELCCNAFKIARQNGDVLTNLFAMMATAGIPGVEMQSVSYIQNALLPHCTNVEAAARFTRFIEDSMKNWFTPVNFFIHSLAQLRFTSDTSDNPSTLSFIPKVYSMDTEGRIESVTIVGYHKIYDPEKYYSYTLKVKRKEFMDPSHVHRTYKQFLELYSKLCINFPMAIRSLKELPRSSGIGRSNVKQVAERRKVLLQAFMDSLLKLADEIAHSDLVYTFFHPLLKDEQILDCDLNTNSIERAVNSPVKIHGKVTICIQYSKGALLVLVKHAHNLACPNGQPPSAYVKTYLQPDPSRLTKRKTRVMKRAQHPTFMEMIEYRLPLDVILKRNLQISVWHYDPLQENSFLGGVLVSLRNFRLEKETTQTFPLGNLLATP